MDVSSIAPNVGVSENAGVGIAGLRGEDFMQILIKQLQYQDPMKPMSNEEMVSQIASIRELETNANLTSRLEQLSDQQRFGSAAGLIGKYAVGEVADAEGNVYPMEGVVLGVKFTQSGDVMLELDSGETLPLKNVTQVTGAE